MGEQISTQIIDEMMTYYRERAQEYDEWFYRHGRYDRGQEANARWFTEVDEVVAALRDVPVAGDVLELAPGTGIWTARLVERAKTVTAVDASPEMIAINKAKVASDRVTYTQANLFTWQPEHIYDATFFGFWLSHVPYEKMETFLDTVARAVRPGGSIFFVDSRRDPTSTAIDHNLPEEGEQVMVRTLNDGRSFQIVKNFLEPEMLVAAFEKAGFEMTVRETATYFVYGYGMRRSS